MRVYLPYEIAEGKVPTLAGMKETHSILVEILQHPAIIGSVIAGSWAANSINPLSDIDGLAVYSDDHTEAVEQAFSTVIHFAQRNRVPIDDFRLFPLSVAQSQFHGISYGYRAHLQNCLNYSNSKDWDLLDHFQPVHLGAIEIAHSYLEHKIRKISQLKYWRTHSEGQQTEQWRTLTEEVLNTPFYATARVFEALGLLPFGHTRHQLMNTLARGRRRFADLTKAIQLLAAISVIRDGVLKSFELACESGNPSDIVIYQMQVQQAANFGSRVEQVLLQLGYFLESAELS